MATEPLYTFRDQDKLLEQNKQKTFGDALRDTSSLFKDTAPQPPAGSPTGTPGATSDPFAAATKSLPDAPKPTGGSFADALRANPFREQAVSGVMESISNAYKPAAPNPADELARNQVIKSQNEALRKVSEASALGGRADTGQLPGDAAGYLQRTLLPQRMDFEAAIRGQGRQEQMQRERDAAGNLLAVEGLAQSGEENAAARAQQESQFGRSLAAQREEAALGRSFTGQQNQLSRDLQQLLTEKGLSLDSRRLEEEIRQFNSAEDWDKSKFAQSLDENERSRIWQAREADVERKYRTGERLDVQEHEVRLSRLNNENTQLNMKLEQTLGIQTAEHLNALQVAREEAGRAFESAMTDKRFTQEQALQESQNVFQAALQRSGFDQAKVLQANEIQAQMIENAKQRQSSELMQKAELALRYDMFREELGVNKEELALRTKQVNQQLQLSWAEFGLQRQEFDVAMQDKKIQDQVGMASMLMSMSDDPAVTKMAAQNVFQAFRQAGYITDEQYQAGLKGLEAPPAATTGGTADTLQTAIDKAEELPGEQGKAVATYLKGVADAGNSPKAIQTYVTIFSDPKAIVPISKALEALVAYIGAPAVKAAIGDAKFAQLGGKG